MPMDVVVLKDDTVIRKSGNIGGNHRCVGVSIERNVVVAKVVLEDEDEVRQRFGRRGGENDPTQRHFWYFWCGRYAFSLKPHGTRYK